jgi:outer membrane receptor protein involved in Fe transport
VRAARRVTVLWLHAVQTFASTPFAADIGAIEGHVQRSRNKSGMADADFNLTGIDSRMEIRPGSFTQLPSTARNTANATLFYELPHVVDVRLGADYISRSLFAIGGSAATDVYSESRLSLDFGSRYFITDDLSVYLNVKNLTNTPLKYAEGTTVRPIQREFYLQTLQFGVNASF